MESHLFAVSISPTIEELVSTKEQMLKRQMTILRIMHKVDCLKKEIFDLGVDH